MKRIMAIVLAAAMLLSTAGCANNAQVPEDLISSEEIILSREDEEPLVSESEFPDAENSDAISATESSSESSVQQAASSAAPSKPAPSSSIVPSKPASSAVPSKPSSSEEQDEEEDQEEDEEEPSSPSVSGEVRAIWVSYLDLAPIIKGRSKSQFQSTISAAFENCANMGLNTVIVQVRPFADAFYESSLFPWSNWIDPSREEGNSPGYDPLAIMVSQAHSKGLKIEAWINPYRIRTDNSVALSDDNQASQWLDEGNDYVVEYKNGLYYNPAKEEVRDLIVSGVEEIVENYAVDGIHFDDYFYPSPDDSFDEDSYDDYKSEGGNMSLGNWRRSNVDKLVKEVYSSIKAIRSSCIFGISPQGNRSNNYNLQYIDVEKWVSTTGYVDYICPQIYWGYNNKSAPFQTVLEEWEDLITTSKVKLYVGLAAYKIGGSESDFTNSTDILMRQVLSSRKQDHYKGFALYRYDSMFNPASGVKSQISKEIKNLKSIL